MAESVDALVSNTSGATRAGSTPALGTKVEDIFILHLFCVLSLPALLPFTFSSQPYSAYVSTKRINAAVKHSKRTLIRLHHVSADSLYLGLVSCGQHMLFYHL